MVANIRGYTPAYKFKLINFDTPRWHTLEYSNWQLVDALFGEAGLTSLRGEWLNNTSYIEGDRVFDPEDGMIYRCQVPNLSAPSGTFAEDRALRPYLWILQTIGVPVYRGDWRTGIAYVKGDIVRLDLYKYYLCISDHTSSTAFSTDVAHWTLIFDATFAVDATEDARDAAQGFASDAATSEGKALTYANNAGASANAAAASATAAESSNLQAGAHDTNAANSAAAAATSATNSANSASASAASSAGLSGTSTTSNTIAIGGKSFVTQAGKQFNPGTYLLIADASAPTVNYMYGQVTSYAGTALGVNVTQTYGSGTISNWQLTVSARPGDTGPAGPGGGGITDAPTDGQAYARMSSTWTPSVKKAGDVMTGPLNLVGGGHWAWASPAGAGSYYSTQANSDRFFAGTDSTADLWRVWCNAVGNAIAINGATGKVEVAADPTTPLGVATKQSSEAAAANAASSKVSKYGDTVSGALTVTGPLTITNNVWTTASFISQQSTIAGGYYFGSNLSGVLYRTEDGIFHLNGGPLYMASNTMYLNAGDGNPAAQSVIHFNASGSRYLYWTGGGYSLTGGTLDIPNGGISVAGAVNFNGDAGIQTTGSNFLTGGTGGYWYWRPYGVGNGTNQVYISPDGSIHLTGSNARFYPPFGVEGGYQCKHGDGMNDNGYYFNFAWVGAYAVYLNTTYIGSMSISDYRMKKNIKPLQRTWELVKKLNPISYSQKEYTPPWEAKDGDKPRTAANPFVPNDDNEQWGFVAHELQEALLPTASTGKKDAYKCLQSPNWLPVVAALTRALQEAQSRIEALEAKLA